MFNFESKYKQVEVLRTKTLHGLPLSFSPYQSVGGDGSVVAPGAPLRTVEMCFFSNFSNVQMVE